MKKRTSISTDLKGMKKRGPPVSALREVKSDN